MSNEPQLVSLRMWSCAGTAANQRCRGRPRCACLPACPSSRPQDTALALCEISAPKSPSQRLRQRRFACLFSRPQLSPSLRPG